MGSPSILKPISKEIERITRVFVDQIHDIVGPDTDIPAPDMGTNHEVMSWFRNQWEKYHGFNPAVITGKTVEEYGAKGREKRPDAVSGLWRLNCSKRLGRQPEKTKVAIQGFGERRFPCC